MANSTENDLRSCRELRELALPGSVMNVRYQMMDVLALQDKLERDVLDGRIDDARTCDAYLRELDEMIAAAQVAKQRMEAARR